MTLKTLDLSELQLRDGIYDFCEWVWVDPHICPLATTKTQQPSFPRVRFLDRRALVPGPRSPSVHV